MKLSDYVAGEVAKLTKHLFLISGGGCIHLVDSFSKTNVKLIPNLHEQAASICAESYSQYTNKIGVALVTTGPGATNALTGIASAWLDSIPVLLITGQVQNKDMVGDRGTRQFGFQEINTKEIYKPITKYSVTITDPKSIKYHFEKAIHLATSGRPGPVVLDIPLDVQAADIDIDNLHGFQPEDYYDDIYLHDMLEKLIEAKRPIVLVGNGVRLAKAEDEFLNFIHKTGIPVLTTWKALDLLDEKHPQFVGRPGGVGQRGANINQQNADFILCIGARLDHGQLAYQPQYFAKNAIKCIVDVDNNEITKLGVHIEYPMAVDAKKFLSKINQYAINLNCHEWLGYCKDMYNKYPVVLDEYKDPKLHHVNNYAFIDALSNAIDSRFIIVPGSSGACSEVTFQALKAKAGVRVYNSQGLGSMGFGIAASIGGALASGKQVICIEGDGGFFMNIQELELVRRYKLPIKFFVLNNDGYGSIKTTQNTHFGGRLVVSDPSSGLTLPSVKLNAHAYGLHYIKIYDQAYLIEDIKDILELNGPIVCEIMVDKNHKTAPKASVFKKPDGSFSTRPMEDLAPFLDREELYNNLFIVEKSLYE